MLQAMNTWHEGSLSTAHATSCVGHLPRTPPATAHANPQLSAGNEPARRGGDDVSSVGPLASGKHARECDATEVTDE